MESVTAVRKRLLAEPPVTGYVRSWIFKEGLDENIVGTGKMAIVVRYGGGWSQPDNVQSSEHPLVIVDCIADSERDDEEDVIVGSAEERAMSLFRVVKPALHGRRGERWGETANNPGFVVISCSLWAEPGPPGKRPGLEDVRVVSAPFAIHTVHGVLV